MIPIRSNRRRSDHLFFCGFLILLFIFFNRIKSRNNEASSYTSSILSTEKPRRFTSFAVENLILEIKTNIKNQHLARLFENHFPNALHTAVTFDYLEDKRPDTFITTDDSEAMWLRHSTTLITPYLPLMKHDPKLKELIEGVLLRQCLCVQIDPYANAFFQDRKRASEWSSIDNTEMRDGIYERKWGLDSLCFVLRLMHSYWIEVDKNEQFFRRYEKLMVKTIEIIVKTIKDQQRFNGSGEYTFQRQGEPPDPRGRSAVPNGLIFSFFRPNDGPQTYGYFIPSQFFAYHTLQCVLQIVEILAWKDALRHDIQGLLASIKGILFDPRMNQHEKTLITRQDREYGLIYLSEIDGFRNELFMETADVPSLLSLPYLCPGDIPLNHSIYQNTRKFILSQEMPLFSHGLNRSHRYGEACRVKPLIVIMRALTTTTDAEIRQCLKILQICHGYSRSVHTSVEKNDPQPNIESWFPSEKSLFGELVWKLYRERKYLLDEMNDLVV